MEFFNYQLLKNILKSAPKNVLKKLQKKNYEIKNYKIKNCIIKPKLDRIILKVILSSFFANYVNQFTNGDGLIL